MFTKIKQKVMKQFTVCPKSGKITGLKKEKDKEKTSWLWIALGLAAVIWVLIRVVPKPSRATYPCQKVAQPIAASFIAWLIGLIGSSLFFRKAHSLFKNQRYIVGAVLFSSAIFLFIFTVGDTHSVAASTVDFVGSTKSFVPTDPANSPVGTAQGINPGRVVWVYDSSLCDQNSTNGWWWEDQRTDPEVAQRMMDLALSNLTGIENPVESWDSLFKYFNKTHYNQDDMGYQAGDKIAIKVNNIFSRAYEWTTSQDNRPCPQMLHALLSQLVNKAGVPEEDITVYDCIFYHGDPVYKYNHEDFPGVRWAEGDATDRVDGHGYENGPGDDPGIREKVVRDSNCVVFYGDPEAIPGSGTVCLPTVVSEAKYLIDLALPRAHELAGFTGCAKNFFGSVWHPTDYVYYHHWQPAFMHGAIAAFDAYGFPMRQMGTYNPLVDLMGHKDLGGKVILYLQETIRYRFWSAPPFNGGHNSSIFVSQDGVAIESVLIDFLRSEGGLPDGTVDNYLHEAAQADNPPSGTVYDPENDGVALQSLGVHEHWNNSTDKQYSRNLGTGEGIELTQIINNTVTGVEYKDNSIVETFTLFANYPNPFNPTTRIEFSVPSHQIVQIAVYDELGQFVELLTDRDYHPGNYSIDFDGSNLSAGVYYYRMQTDNFSKTMKMLLLK